eukprot:2062498-Rhodomonas_salina.2
MLCLLVVGAIITASSSSSSSRALRRCRHHPLSSRHHSQRPRHRPTLFILILLIILLILLIVIIIPGTIHVPSSSLKIKEKEGCANQPRAVAFGSWERGGAHKTLESRTAAHTRLHTLSFSVNAAEAAANAQAPRR